MSNAPDFDVGDLAEDVFTTWCSQAGIASSVPRKDRDGWDRHLSIPSDDSPLRSGSRPASICYVQVKGHRVDDPTPPAITLSNWQRMISIPVPWFVCIIQFSPKAEPLRAHLVHIGEAWIIKARKRLWTHSEGDDPPLNRATLSCSPDDADVLTRLHGELLIQTLRRHIGDPLAYFSAKKRWYDEAGLDKRQHQVSVTFDPEMTESILCDFSLGLRTDLHASRMVVSEVRFGHARMTRDLKDVTFEIPTLPSFGKAQVMVRSLAAPRETVSVECDAYASTHLFPFLPEQHQRVRLVAPLMSISLTRDSMSFSWKLPAEPLILSDAAAAAKVLRAFAAPAKPEIEFRFPAHTEWMPIHPADAALPTIPESVREVISPICNAAEIVRAFGVDPRSIKVRIDDLLRQEQAIAALAKLYRGNTIRPSVRFTDPSTAMSLQGQAIAKILVLGAWIGSHFFLQCVAILGTAIVDGQTSTVSFSDPEICVVEKAAIDKNEMPEERARALLHDMIRRAQDEYGADGRTILLDEGSETHSS